MVRQIAKLDHNPLHMQPRLAARKTVALEALIYRTLVRPSLRRAFVRVALGGVDPFDPLALPTLFYANHPSWWDGYLAFLLSYEHWQRDGYIMMEEDQLARYSFFRRCGAFSVDRHDPREGMRSVAYTAQLLVRHPQRVAWIFPQGEITPNDRRPLRTYSGAAHIAKRATPIRCAPVAFRYEFGTEQRPEALIRIGTRHVVIGPVNVKNLQREMDERLLREVDQLRDDTVNGATASYTTILAGRESINMRWDRLRERL
jgi:chlorobactene lauroyltransferase